MSQAIAVFAKAPLPGRVKTRLRTCLTAAQAAELHAAFVADTWRRLAVLTGVRRYLYCDQAWEPFEELAGPEQFAIQHGVDLGARMLNCMKELSLCGHDRILLLGSDSPTLPIAHVEQAFLALDRTDTVLGPTADGGYYAVGCRRPDTRMFAGVTWSSEDTLRETEAAFHALFYERFVASRMVRRRHRGRAGAAGCGAWLAAEHAPLAGRQPRRDQGRFRRPRLM